jgi:pimeloyl-ACP methyl ester carboxylesterase
MVVEVAHRDVGTGLPVVLLHAFPLSAAMWLAQREELAPEFRLITPDQRGFGGSPLGEDEPSLDHVVDDVIALLDAKGLDRVVLGGLSMGGYVAMALLRRHADRVRALVLADTRATADADEGRQKRLAMADTLDAMPDSDVVLTDVFPPLLGETTQAERPMVMGRVKGLAEAAPAAAVAWAQRAMAARTDAFEVLRSVAVPTLVVVGEEDGITPVSDSEAIAAAVPGARLSVLARAGHLSAVEVPDQFNDVVREFLSSLG